MVKHIVHPVTSQTFALGRNRPVVQHPHLKLRSYLYRGLPKAPDAVHYTKKPLSGLENPLGNVRVGDCTCAGIFHCDDTWSINAGTATTFANEADAIGLYSTLFGYVPGDPSTDKGGDLQTVLAYAQKHGIYADGRGKTAGYIAVDAHDVEVCRFAIWVFGCLYGGYELPDAWVNPPPSGNGFLWRRAGAPDPSNGHCTMYPGYNENEFVVDTWGMIGGEEVDAFVYYHTSENGGELYVPLSSDWISRATQKAPSGFDWTQLQADLDAIHR
jgi:hypothetical protein